MITVLVVDDERIIRQGISRLIEEKCSNYRVIGEAHNGERALALTEELRPNLVIIDIRMPIMDGLEYVRLVNTREYIPRIIVLSGYAEFEYARQLIGFNCEAYLLKPVKHREFTSLLGRISSELEQRSLRENDTIPSKSRTSIWPKRAAAIAGLKDGINYDDDAVDETFASLVANHYWLAIMSTYKFSNEVEGLSNTAPQNDWVPESHLSCIEQQLREMHIKAVVSHGMHGEIVLIIADKKTVLFTDEDIKSVLGTILNDFKRNAPSVPSMGYSGPHSGKSAFQTAYKQSECAVENSFFEGWGGIYRSDENTAKVSKIDTYPLERQILTALDVNDAEKMLLLLGELLDYLSQNRVKKKFIDLVLTKLYIDILNVLERKGRIDILDVLPNSATFSSRILVSTTSGETRDQVLQLMARIVPLFSDSSFHNRTISLAKQYAQANVHLPIGTADAAEYVGLNSSYFSALFTKETGDTFTNYVNKMKIGHAMERLRQPSSKIQDVSNEIGISDARYFARLFRKVVGMTPKEYRDDKCE